MTAETELRIANLYKGKPLSKALYAIEVARAYHATKALELRIKIAGLTIG